MSFRAPTASGSVDLLVEEIANGRIELFSIRVGKAEHREMRPQAIDDPELAVRDQFLLGLAIGRWEKHVAGERHDIGLRFDPAESRLEISASMQADVAVAPL